MEYFKFVEDSFNAELKRIFGEKREIYNFLNNHERKPLLFQNLKKEILEAELRSATLISPKVLEFIGKEFAKTFSELCLRAQEKKHTSEAEIQRRLHSAHEFDEIQQMIAESSKDYVEELRIDGTKTRTEI